MHFPTRIHVFNLAFLLFFLPQQNSGYLCNTQKSSISCIFHVFYIYFTWKKMLYVFCRVSLYVFVYVYVCIYLLSRSICISTSHREITESIFMCCLLHFHLVADIFQLVAVVGIIVISEFTTDIYLYYILCVTIYYFS